MRNTTKKQYEIFKEEFLKWQMEFGLLEWKVFFEWVDFDGFAAILPDHSSMGVVVSMCENVKEKDWHDFDPPDCAKHEAIHLLTADIWYIGKCRYIRADDIDQAWERLVVKLEKLI